MSDLITASLHELVFAMDAYADPGAARPVRRRSDLFAFLAPLASDPMDVTRLAGALNFTNAAISKRVARLEREGWLVTAADPQHHRRVVLSLSPAGAALIQTAAPLLEAQFAALLAGNGIDAPAFHAQLRSLIEAIRTLDEADR